MNVNHAPAIKNENPAQQMLDSTPPKQANDSSAAKTFEFAQPTSSPISGNELQSNNAPTLIQNLLQSLQSLLSQAGTQPSTESNEAEAYSESLRGFESSNMTMRQSSNASLRATLGDARVEDPDSGHEIIELDNGDRTEVFTVQEGERKRVRDTSQDDNERALRPGEAVNGRTNLDPRVESFFGERISSSGVDDYNFTAQYNITRAKETTVFQMLNADLDASDTRVPVLFLEAYTYEDANGNTRVRLTDGAVEPVTLESLRETIRDARQDLQGESNRGERDRLNNIIDRAENRIRRQTHPELGFSEFPIVYDGPKTFDLEVDTDGRGAEVRVTPSDVEGAATQTYRADFDRDPSTPNVRDLGDFSNIRYGAYHHDGEGTEPIQSTARLRVTNANLSRNQPE